MTEEQKQALIHELESRRAIMRIDSDKLWEYDWFSDEAYRIALAALTQPTSPDLKLPDEASLRDACHAVANATHESRVGSYQDGWIACIAEVKRLNAPHTAPIEPICATGGTEWVKVPREPTRQMMSQGHFAMAGTDRGKFRRIYQAMIAAAPQPE
ncbi:hypothetical protein [Pantoea sp. S18]|uniref:hypothetical protein n=1 Tax=Pantoea sp. S18 TaxID=3019892 RepID=UPI002B21680C|nr:hypothetical protein [Pantoea sp. S18]MEA5104736.1 hypothetical protein [Pantoea sp. S18]